ncbi:MAG: hypothetical protein P8X88_09525 [Gammaproteobacteria bacterium]
MKFTKAILLGIFIYLLLFFAEKGVHFLYFYITHNFGTDNLLLIKSSLILNFAPILGGLISGYLCNKGIIAGFLVGIISGSLVLIYQQLTGANPLTQDYTPSIVFDEVFIKGCIASLAGATGELIKLKNKGSAR